MINVLVVDDSIFMRTMISDILNSDPEIKVVGVAKNGSEAMKKTTQLKPNVITLDISMPGENGLTVLKNIMSKIPTPVVMLSAYSKEGADITMDCLKAGAVGFVLKPSGELSLDIDTVEKQIITEVKTAFKADFSKIGPVVAQKQNKPKIRSVGKKRIIIMGASTGGPQTLENILSPLPPDFPIPIMIVQHMPNRFFTESMAEHLNKVCKLTVKAAENGEAIRDGSVYLVPSGYQLVFETVSEKGNKNESIVIRLVQEESNPLSPSIDNVMKNAVRIYGAKTIGIVLTGMGKDGVEGMREIKKAEGKTIAQDESALIFGMPKEVIDAGAADFVLPAREISKTLLGFEQGKNANRTQQI